MIKTVKYLNKERVVAFSDGVIAIIITLMVLEIHLPHISNDLTSNEIWTELSTMIPSLLAYMASFYGLGIFWSNHHHFFYMLKHTDITLIWLNLNFLFWLSLIPLPTAFLAEHYDKAEATTIYGGMMLMSHFSIGLIVLYASRKNLILDNYNKKAIKKILIMIFASCALWITAIIVGYYSTYISYIIILIIAIAYALPKNLELHDDIPAIEDNEENERLD